MVNRPAPGCLARAGKNHDTHYLCEEWGLMTLCPHKEWGVRTYTVTPPQPLHLLELQAKPLSCSRYELGRDRPSSLGPQGCWDHTHHHLSHLSKGVEWEGLRSECCNPFLSLARGPHRPLHLCVWRWAIDLRVCPYPAEGKPLLVPGIRTCIVVSLEQGNRSLMRLKIGNIEMNHLQSLPSRKDKQ